MNFEAQTTQFSLTNAFALAKASRLAYESEAAILDQLSGWGMQGKFFDSPTNTQLFIAYDTAKAIISFRGTEGEQLTDWLVNANTKKTQEQSEFNEELGVCFDVHSGFYLSVRSIWEDLIGFIEQKNLESKPIWFTGHSLGGALAILSAMRWRELQKSVAGVYTFGAPRVGGSVFHKQFTHYLRGHFFRFVNNRDLVPRIPLFLTGYMHVGELLFFDKQGRLHRDYAKHRIILEFFKELFAKFKTQVKKSLKDHSMDGYIDLLQQLKD